MPEEQATPETTDPAKTPATRTKPTADETGDASAQRITQVDASVECTDAVSLVTLNTAIDGTLG